MNKPLLKWSPAQPVRIPDNIVSSGAREKKQLGFTPTYESTSCQHMNFLMSNEYMRIWFKERSQYEKDIYTREQIIKEESKIKRRICQRMMTYRRPSKNQFIEDKVQKGKDELEKNYDRLKFKPECQKKKGSKKSKDSKDTKDSNDSKDSKDSKDSEAKEGEGDVEEIVICTNVNNDCEENK